MVSVACHKCVCDMRGVTYWVNVSNNVSFGLVLDRVFSQLKHWKGFESLYIRMFTFKVCLFEYAHVEKGSQHHGVTTLFSCPTIFLIQRYAAPTGQTRMGGKMTNPAISTLRPTRYCALAEFPSPRNQRALLWSSNWENYWLMKTGESVETANLLYSPREQDSLPSKNFHHLHYGTFELFGHDHPSNWALSVP